MDVVGFLIGLLKDPRTAIAGWIIALGPIWVYTPLFLVVFCETGLVVTPFLPGDSLLFASGVFCADGGGLDLFATLTVFILAAVLGNTSNYWIGRGFGHAIIDSGKVKALTPERIAKVEGFFDRWGALTVVITRFFPIIRTIVPFICGTSKMKFPKFMIFNIIGGVCWVCLFVLMGYFFGGIPWVQTHFEWVLVAIIVVSLAPTVIGLLKAKMGKKEQGKHETVDTDSAE